MFASHANFISVAPQEIDIAKTKPIKKMKININKLEIIYTYSSDGYFETPEEIVEEFYFEVDDKGVLREKIKEKDFGDAREL